MDAKLSLARKWVIKARRDLLSAKKLVRGKDPYFDTAIYHCQQSAEKVIKGWLDVAVQISPYATAYRYPGEVLEPTDKEFSRAFKIVSALYEFVCSMLPNEASAP